MTAAEDDRLAEARRVLVVANAARTKRDWFFACEFAGEVPAAGAEGEWDLAARSPSGLTAIRTVVPVSSP